MLFLLIIYAKEIGKLTRIKVLDLSGNRLVTLPDSMVALREFKSLYLRRNPTLAKPQSRTIEAWLEALRAGAPILFLLPMMNGNLISSLHPSGCRSPLSPFLSLSLSPSLTPPLSLSLTPTVIASLQLENAVSLV